MFEYDLELTEQFDYVKPVLAAVIEGKYGPSRAAHEGFMRGAGARQKVLNTVPLRGSLSARDKEEVAYLVRSWARRRERRRELGVSVEYPPEKFYPPVGGSAGEARKPAAGDKKVNGHVSAARGGQLMAGGSVMRCSFLWGCAEWRRRFGRGERANADLGRLWGRH